MFVCGNVYCVLHTWLTYRCLYDGNVVVGRHKVFYLQLVLCVVSAVSLVMTGVFYASKHYVVSSFSEWIMCCSLVIFFLTFYGDVKRNPRVGVMNDNSAGI